MNKKVALVVAVVVVLLAVAGWFVGPQLWSRLSSPETPLGRIAAVETVDSFAPESAGTLSVGPGLTLTFIGGGSPALSAEEGYQLWVVRFHPMAGKPDEQSRKVSAVDDAGEKHAASWMEVKEEEGKSQASLVFCIPRPKTPQSIQFGETPPLTLPTP